MQAVITGDLIDSTKYKPKELDIILNEVNDEFKSLIKQHRNKVDFKIYRGDSFQGVVLDPTIAFSLVLKIKAAINKLLTKNNNISGLTDFRIAIGIGEVNLKRASILESNGEAFQFSGKTLDSMKGDYPRLLLKTADKEINDEFNVHFSLLDGIMSKWSRASAEVVYYMLNEYKEKEIADILNINQSAVNQRKKVANWDAISLLITRYTDVIAKYTNNGS